MRILHIVPDDKFIDRAIREFEATAPGLHLWVVLGGIRPLKYITSSAIAFLSVREICKYIRSEECAAVVFHSLNPEFFPLLKRIPADKKIIWIGWGFDYYSKLLSMNYSDGLLLPKTKHLSLSIPKQKLIFSLLLKIKDIAKLSIGLSVRYNPDMLSRIDIFVPQIDVEYDMACKYNPWFKPKYLSWNYGTVEGDFMSTDLYDSVQGNNILVGNSASFENNHIEVFDLIHNKIELSSQNLIVPLSYGSEWYRDQVISYGEKLFGKKFIPIVDFMPINDYIKLLDSCGYVFMNHLRQQAISNICLKMLTGASIYLDIRNPLYNWFRGKGGIIRSINDFNKIPYKNKTILSPLTEKEKITNIEIIKTHWGEDAQRKKTRMFIETAFS